MATLKKVLEEWDLLPSKKRNGRLAKEMAKTIVLKVAGVFGKNFLKSMGEARFLKDIRDSIRAKKLNSVRYEAETWEYQPEIKHYTPDFKVKVGHSYHYIEYKGKMTQQIRNKIRDIIRCNPDKSFILVFERGKNKLTGKKNSITYMTWAKRNKIPAFNMQDSDYKKKLIEYLHENSILV